MSSPSFAIVDLRDGTRRDVEPFLLENDAFPVLENAYLFRGRVQRRSCFSKMGSGLSRLRWQIGTTDGSGNFSYTLPDAPITSAVSQFISGTSLFTDSGVAGAPANLLSITSATATLNRSSGALTITGSDAAAAVFYYPGLPVMGLRVREQNAINDELSLDFDTRYSYIFDTATTDFIGANTYKTSNVIFTWSGSDSDLFWSTNYYSVFWATNNIAGLNAQIITGITAAGSAVVNFGVTPLIASGDYVFFSGVQGMVEINGLVGLVTAVGATTITVNINSSAFTAYTSGGLAQDLTNKIIAGKDGIKFYDGPGAGTGWVNFAPPLSTITSSSVRYLNGCLIILPYKDRLLVLNTYESTGLSAPINFKQRARWSQNGTPFYASNSNVLPVNQAAQASSWVDDTPGLGGYIDAPTAEAIVSAEFIKDTLIVYFERSTWQLVYTNNETLPFIWQKINTELGCESTFSIVPFDRGAFGIGNYGIITTDSVNVARIDQKIPDEVFQIQNSSNGVKRAVGIRDYNAQFVYWSYPIVSDEDGETDTYTLTFPNQVLLYNYLDGSWAEFDDSFTCFGYWQNTSDKSWAQVDLPWQSINYTWNSQVQQAKYPNVIAGNQRGFVMVFSQLQNLGRNSPSLEISNMSGNTITCPNHNFVNNQYVLITGSVGFTAWNGNIYKVVNATVNTFDIQDPTSASGYLGAGLITHIPNFTVRTKQFNPFYEQGKSVRVNYIDLYMDRTSVGQLTADFYTSSNSSEAIDSQIVLTSPEPNVSFSANQTRIFHRVYTNAFGSFFQNVFTLSDSQIRDLNVSSADMRIHGLIYYINAAGRVSYDL